MQELVSQFRQMNVGDFVTASRFARVREAHELGDIVWPAGFDARTETGSAHAAEWLSQHDGTDGRPIDVKVPGANARLPDFLLAIIETFQTGSESVAGL